MKKLLLFSALAVGVLLAQTYRNFGPIALNPGMTISTSGPVTVADPGYYLNNAAGALTYNLPVITSRLIGVQFCFRNAVTRTGVVTLQLPASTFLDNAGVNGTAAGTYVSGGALGDSACVVAQSTTQYVAYPGVGSWTGN